MKDHLKDYLVECENCKGLGWAWDKNSARIAKDGRFVHCKKWKYCGWCMGTGKTDPWQCDKCHGCGWMSDDSYSSFGCPWCQHGHKKGAPRHWKWRNWGEDRMPNPRKKREKKPELSRWDQL